MWFVAIILCVLLLAGCATSQTAQAPAASYNPPLPPAAYNPQPPLAVYNPQPPPAATSADDDIGAAMDKRCREWGGFKPATPEYFQCRMEFARYLSQGALH
jgi:hypothetical protein